jgi:alpha-D-ribose 1-methylphosphonate 5-triphosphate synthase subunit PhnG
MHQWSAAVNRSLVKSGTIVARLGYSFLTGRDPMQAVKSTNRLLQADITFNF